MRDIKTGELIPRPLAGHFFDLRVVKASRNLLNFERPS